MSVEFDNASRWTKALQQAVGRMEQSINDAMTEAQTRVVLRTVEYTPTKSGTLAASRRAYVEQGRDVIQGTVSYNEDRSAPYAIEQHETREYSHAKPWNPPKAQYRFLARAYEDELNNIRRIFKRGVKFK